MAVPQVHWLLKQTAQSLMGERSKCSTRDGASLGTLRRALPRSIVIIFSDAAQAAAPRYTIADSPQKVAPQRTRTRLAS